MTARGRMAGVDETVPAPAFMDAEIIAPRSHVHREQAFQLIAVQFIRKVVKPPMFVTATVNENEMTDNARARAKARGMVAGLYDLYVAQGGWGKSCWLELKWGKNRPSDAQNNVGAALDACGIPRGYAWSIHQIVEHLRTAGFALHGGADVLAQEYQARAEAAVRKAELRAAAPRKAGKSRAPRFTARDRKAAGIYGAMLQDPHT